MKLSLTKARPGPKGLRTGRIETDISRQKGGNKDAQTVGKSPKVLHDRGDTKATKSKGHGDKNKINKTNLEGFRPDTAAYPRLPKGTKRKAETDTRPQQDQCWHCPLCQLNITIPAGPNARKRLLKFKCNHLQTRHTCEERRSIRIRARLGNVMQVYEASVHIPLEERSWTCKVCSAGLPHISIKANLERSKMEHFKAQHPDLDPKSAQSFTSKTGIIRTLREAQENNYKRLAKVAEAKGHVPVSCWISPKPGAPDAHKIVLPLCSRCLITGTQLKFKRAPCGTTEVAPSKTITILRKMIFDDPSNALAIQTCLAFDGETWGKTNIIPKSHLAVDRIAGYRSVSSDNHVLPGYEQLGFPRGEQKLADLRHGGHNAERIGEASHPGPANIINQISVYCCNVQSATGAWALLEHGSCKTDELRIWCLQETRMKDYEAQAFHRAAQRRGYKVYQLAGNTTLDRWGQPRAAGGVAMLIDNRLSCCNPLYKLGSCSQTLGIWVEDWFVCTFYAPPDRSNRRDNAQTEVAEQITEILHESQAQRWLFCGDANEIPGDSTIEAALVAQGGTTLQINRGTRWQSDREIDWFNCNDHSLCLQPQCVELHVSDHVPLCLQIPVRDVNLQIQALQMGPNWAKPAGLDQETWREHVEKVWENMSDDVSAFKNSLTRVSADVVDVDADWDRFMVLLDTLMRQSFSDIAANNNHPVIQAEAGKRLKQKQIKGRMPSLKTRQRRRCHPQLAQGDMQVAKLRRKVARLFELQRCLQKSINETEISVRRRFQNTAKDLIKKLRLGSEGWSLRHVWYQLNDARPALAELEKSVRERRLAQWRERIENDIKYASKWLKSRNKPQNVHISVQGAPEPDPNKAVQHLRNFWTGFWKESDDSSPDDTAIIQQLLQDTPLREASTWEPPTAIMVKAQATNSRGSAGADGWTGEELGSLPLGVWELFTVLSASWLRQGSVPTILLQARAVFLPKPNKVAKGLCGLADVRPITVLPAWWRIWLSAWLQTSHMTVWISEVLDESVVYGKQSDAQTSAAGILDAYGRHGYLASLDFTKCFDLLRPSACCALLKQNGFCHLMSDLCSHFWTKHVRWCTWQQVTDHTTLCSGHMAVPQGDPWGPLMIALYLSAGQRYIRQRLPHVVGAASNYMDDRSFTSTTAIGLVETIQGWAEWSAQVGLRESEKGQCTARSLKNKEALQACLHNQSMFVQEATFLGVSTRGAPRRNSDKENARVADACNQYKLLATLRLSAERYAFYSRYFAISKVTYGWLGRSPTQGLCSKLWNALKAGQRVTHMANRWIRAMVHGGLNHLDILAATNLLRVVYGIWNKGLASWNSIAGTPVATLRKWMRDKGWIESGPWNWTHEFRLAVNFHDSTFHIELGKHLLRDGWRLWCWDQVLHTSRHEVQDLHHTQAKDLLSLDWDLIRKVAATNAGCRTVSVGASVSPAWRGELCPFCHNTLGSWQHLAWHCPASPVADLRPHPMPIKAISWRFGWDNDPEILRYLGCVQHALWDALYRTNGAAADDVEVASDGARADDAAADGAASAGAAAGAAAVGAASAGAAAGD